VAPDFRLARTNQRPSTYPSITDRHTTTMTPRPRSSGSRSATVPLLPRLPLLLAAIAVGQARAGLLWGGGSSDDAATTTNGAAAALALGAAPEPVHLDWEDINCVLTTKDGRKKPLLNAVCTLWLNSKLTFVVCWCWE
jgi:hypothetical protein